MSTAPNTDLTSIEFNQALSERYLAYAMSTIMSRALPDVRDGLKPVHRRLLYAMYQLKLSPKSSFKKSARVVGDVMGKFHPHGDSAIYDALVRLAQDFSVRYPLIDGQGNFGNIDGDNAAAMRYTEARLTDIALLLFEGIEDKTVDFVPTYDSEGEEPAIFPATFPNLLANGSSGIAVGMATNIPPHNLHELCLALKALLKNPHLSDDDLYTLVPGPDFPTGGVLVEDATSIQRAYTTGKGSFRVRAAYMEEPLKGGGYNLIITAIPNQVQKSKLLEKIAELMHLRKLPLLGHMMDESTEDLRIVLEPKSRNVNPVHLMESLFRQTDLDVRISLNMNVLTLEGKPEVLSLRAVLMQFLTHRFDILKRRTQCRIDHIESRLHLLDGFLVAYLNLDDVIEIIRYHEHPKQELMHRFTLSDVQAEAILNMRLRSLRKLQEIEIKQEHAELSTEHAHLTDLLNSQPKQVQYLSKELTQLSKTYGPDTALGRRRTTLSTPPEKVDWAEIEPVEIEPITFTCSEKGWIRIFKGHITPDDIKYKDGDTQGFVLCLDSNQKIMIMSRQGRVFTLLPDKLTAPLRKGSASQGDALRLVIDLDPTDEIAHLSLLNEADTYIIMNQKGRGFRVQGDSLFTQTKQGKTIMNCQDGEYMAYIERIVHNHVALLGQHRKLLILDFNDIPIMQRGRGVTLQKYRDGSIADIMQIDVSQGLTYLRGRKNTTEKDLTPWLGKRGSTGRMAPLGFPRTNTFDAASQHRDSDKST